MKNETNVTKLLQRIEQQKRIFCTHKKIYKNNIKSQLSSPLALGLAFIIGVGVSKWLYYKNHHTPDHIDKKSLPTPSTLSLLGTLAGSILQHIL